MTVWPEIISDDPEMMADWESLSATEKATIEETQGLVDAFVEEYNNFDEDDDGAGDKKLQKIRMAM